MRRALSITRREWPLRLCGALLLAAAVAAVLLHRGGRKKPLAAAAAGVALLAAARSLRADPDRDEVVLAWTALGVPLLALRRGRVSSLQAVSVGGGPLPALSLATTGRPLPLWRAGSRLAARRLAARLARALELPLRDEACAPPRTCAAGALDLALGPRLRLGPEAPAPPLPPGTRLRVAAGAQLAIAFPARLRARLALPALAVAPLLALAARAFGPVPLPAPVLAGLGLAVAGALVLGWAVDHRPTTLLAGRAGLTLRGPWRRRSLAFTALQDVAPTRAGLELLAERRLLRVAHRVPEDLRFAAAAVERAARAHAGVAPAAAPPPSAAGAPPPRSRAVAAGALALGVALLAAAVLADRRAATFGGRAQRADGFVTRVTVVPGSGVQDLSIRFRTAAGGEAAFTAHLREALGTPGAGATVPVAYDDADPGRARLDVGRPLDATALALACAALGALLVGLGLWVRGRSVGHHR